ncbi:MAG: nitronate monooxygenase [Thermoguttaceae bacterium]|jgi:NAD(P)H-dependent flavin oxidoreductase YrpB (nitropropane dioxygenase family)
MTLQELLGIELPIIQAPMAGVQGSTLAVAASNAGGLGSLPCAMLGLDATRKELTAIRLGNRTKIIYQTCCGSTTRVHLGSISERGRLFLSGCLTDDEAI